MKSVSYLSIALVLVSFTASSSFAGSYQDHQVRFLEDAVYKLGSESDRIARRHFGSLALQAAEYGPVSVADLPDNWQSAISSRRGLGYRDRLLELEAFIEAMSPEQRDAKAEAVARMQVCLFHARHQMSEGFLSWNSTGTYMDCAESAYARIVPRPAVARVRVIPSSNGELLPPDASAGQCYARVYLPAKYESEQLRVLRKEASERLEIIPAQFALDEESILVKEASTVIAEVPAHYEWQEEQVLVKEASSRIEQIPAVYKTVDERVLVKEASTRLEAVPAQYDWVEEEIVDRPAHTMWKKGGKLQENLDNSTGEVVCLVEIPAIYRTVRKRVLVSPPTTRTVEIPAAYNRVQKQVLVSDATTRTIPVPAEYETIRKRVLVSPASTVVTEVPAEYATVRVQRLVSPAVAKSIPEASEYETVAQTHLVRASSIEWRPVLCETNLTNERVQWIQKALKKAGYNPGRIDGRISAETLSATEAYQTDRDLATGGITWETVRRMEKEMEDYEAAQL